MVGVVVGLYLPTLGLSPAQTGLVIGLGLAGAACASAVVTLGGDRIGRRRVAGELRVDVSE